MNTACVPTFWGILLFLCYLLQVLGSSRVSSRRINTSFRVDRGDATLTCQVRNIGKKRVIWTRLADSVPISVGTTRFNSANKKYRVRRNKEDWQLVIKNFHQSDIGEYECRLTGQGDVSEIVSVIYNSSNHAHFLQTATVMSTKLGSDVVLPCHINNLRKSLVMWMKGSIGAGKVLSLRKKIHSGDKRHKVLHTQRPEWSLQIRRVRPEDFGVYTCVVNTDPPITRTLELQEGKPDKVPEGNGNDKVPEIGPSKGGNPSLVKDTFKEEVEVTQYESVTLTCQFEGDPKPKVQWERRLWTPHGDKVIEDLKFQGESYRLVNAQPKDGGVYVCKANNGLPPPAQGRIIVKVKEVPTTTTTTTTTTPFYPREDAAPRVYPLQEMIYGERGREIELGCKAVGLPRPRVQWLANGELLQQSAKYRLFNQDFGRHTVFSTLNIRSLSRSDFKEYTCYAVNRFGNAEGEISLEQRVL